MATRDTRTRPVTLRDVAQLAGVSVATASKALNGKADVHPDTRRRVQEVADRLAFTPNSLARAITAGRTGTVGLLTHDLEGRFSLPILMGAEDAFGAGSTSVFLCDAREDAIREQHHLRALLGRRVDGLIVVGSRTDSRSSLGPDVPVPVVYAYAPSDDPDDASVVPDNVSAGRLAAEHLLTLGRRRIAHVSGDPTYAAAQDRATGVGQALAAAGLEQVGPVRFGSWSEAWGRAGVSAALDADPGIDAVVCGSDMIARGVLDALRERGVRVPQDVAVIGFDNWEPMIAGSRPALTSVDMNFETMGRRAATRLFSRIAGAAERGVETIAPRVVVRASTASG
ncbi:LacI family DNA-binding transcriptional regulator [Cellulomonas sp. zg-ZUI22]|uniref:LacI family DNA-binding transcriptional regulator n=1 Tax=Cellulomonas sp. zg-ZUI22 TaxID=2816955 RepID=UPI001A93F658|nr:LacI family DNA-binding transcriptional regulator [Cellulomonas sp. zg-ZUI22]MBO0900930.1 LacI family DNA-binding transcriptional regulator [Cellulomonas sp. zg-ZUI22]